MASPYNVVDLQKWEAPEGWEIRSMQSSLQLLPALQQVPGQPELHLRMAGLRIGCLCRLHATEAGQTRLPC